jgi:beta-mannosidase
MMFACSMYPTDSSFLDSVTNEMTYQVKRLSRHPSLVAWTANNENEGALVDNWYGTSGPDYELYKQDYVKLYIDTIRTAILSIDPVSRPFLSSSPTNGKVTENAGWISENPRPGSPLFGDVHYYNYDGDCLNYNIFPSTRYASEYGYQSWPSYHTLKKIAIPSEDLYYRSQFFQHREHHEGAGNGTDLTILRHFGWPNSGDIYRDFQSYIYLTQAAQAVCYQSETEFYRRSRSDPNMMTMGALYWQHNDIWQAPTWSTIDYDGKWKMAHYFAARFFADPIVSIVDESPIIAIYTITDSLTDLLGLKLIVQVWTWSSAVGTPLYQWNITVNIMSTGSYKVFEMSRAQLLAVSGCPAEEQCLLTGHIESAGTPLTPSNAFYFVSWKYAVGLQNPNMQVTDVSALADPDTFSVTVRTAALAAFTWLEAVDVGGGRFSDNGFLMTSQERSLTFYARRSDVTAEQLRAAIVITTLFDVL